MEDRKAHGGFFGINDVPSLFGILPLPAIRWSAGADRQVVFQPGLPMAVRVLDNLFALTLGAPCQNGADKLTSQAVVNVLADTDNLAAVALNLLEDHGGMDKVTG